MAARTTLKAVLPWVWRLGVGAAILAAPIITFRAFTDEETPDPQRDQRLREVQGSARPRAPADTTNRPDPAVEPRP